MSVGAKSKAKKEVMYDGQYLRLIRRGEWEYIGRNNCRGIVIIVAMTDEKRVLFVDQYREPVRKRVIEFPAGLVGDRNFKNNESVVTTAKRELLEETGYKAARMHKIIDGPVSSGCCSDIVTMLRAEGLKKVGEGGGDELESIIVHEVPLEKAERWLARMRRKGYLVEPKIYAGLYFLKTELSKNA